MRNFINEKYKVDFPVPVGVQELIDFCEKADDENDFGTYMVYAEAVDIAAKNCCAKGILTQKQWDILSARYE